MNRRSVLGFLFILVVCAGSLYSQELVFNTQDFAPFTYMREGAIPGPAVDLIKAVCAEAGITYKAQLLPWVRAQNEVKTGDAHALFLIGWNKERAETLSFTPPILNSEYGIFVNKDNPLRYAAPEQLKGYKIGVYGPSNTATSLEDLKKKATDITVDMTTDDESAFRKLELGRVKAVYSNRDVGAALIAKLGLKNVVYSGPDKKLQYYIGFSKQFTDKALFDKFVEAYRKLYANGTVQKILGSYNLETAKL